MMTRFQSITGTKDVLPEEAGSWRTIESLIHETMRQWGYEEIRTPAFEQTELFIRSSGEDSEIVSKQMYSFFDQGKNNLTLKPELTAPVIRAYIQHNLARQGALTKLYYIDALFRQEKPQAGRLRQFHQFGVEAIGSLHPEQDAEVIALAYHVLHTLGLKNVTLHLNSIGSPQSRTRYRTELVKFLSSHKSQLSKTNQRRLKTNPLRILDSQDPEEQSIIKKGPRILDYLQEEDLSHYNELKNSLKQLGIPFVQGDFLVRGLDYYTRTTFEIISPDLGAQDALCGGGRYDNLVEELGGQPTPAVGFAAGIERILLALKNKPLSDQQPTISKIFIASATESARAFCLKLATDLRLKGIPAEFDTLGRSLKAQMRGANRLNSIYAVIIGEKEIGLGTAIVKTLQTGEERTIPLNQIFEYLGKLSKVAQ